MLGAWVLKFRGFGLGDIGDLGLELGCRAQVVEAWVQKME